MHIVIFTGGESPAPVDAAPYFACRAPDFVIAADSGLVTLERYRECFGGFAPDLILGDMDSLGDKSLLRQYPADIVRTFMQDKDATDTELALEEAHRRASADDWITLVGASGGSRADHFLAVFDLFATALRPDCWLCGTQSFWYVCAGRSFSVGSLGLRDVVSVARTTASRTGGSLCSEGLLWEYDRFRAEGMPSVSNRIAPAHYERGKDVRVSVQEGDFVLILPLSARVRVHESPAVSKSTASEKDISATASASNSP